MHQNIPKKSDNKKKREREREVSVFIQTKSIDEKKL